MNFKNLIYLLLLLTQSAFAINHTPLNMKWEYQIGQSMHKPVLGKDGSVYASPRSYADTQPLYAFTQEGKVKWIFTESGGDKTYLKPVIASDDTIYLIGSNGIDRTALFKAFTSDGTILWAKTFTLENDERVESLEIDPNNNLFLMTQKYIASRLEVISTLTHFDTKGEIKWKFKVTGSAYPIISKDGSLYVIVAYSGVIYHLSSDGRILWSTQQIGDIKEVQTTKDGLLYILSPRDLYVLNKDGQSIWSKHNIEPDFNYSFSHLSEVSNGRIFLTAKESNWPYHGVIYSIDLDGNLVWKKYINDYSPGKITIGKDNMLYIALADERGGWNTWTYLAGYDMSGNKICQSTKGIFNDEGVTVDMNGIIYTGGTGGSQYWDGLTAFYPCKKYSKLN